MTKEKLINGNVKNEKLVNNINERFSNYDVKSEKLSNSNIVIEKPNSIGMTQEKLRNYATYKTTINMAKQMLFEKLISKNQYYKFETIIAEKYGIFSNSIYREIDLICSENGANM